MDLEKCIKQHAPIVGKKQKCHLSQPKIDRFIVEIVIRNIVRGNEYEMSKLWEY